MKSDTTAELAFRRRLTILVMLHERPRTKDELVRTLAQKALFSTDHEEQAETIARCQSYQFQSDLKVLRLGQVIIFNQKSKLYSWENSPFGISLDHDLCSALAVLTDTFANSSLPHAVDIRRLLTTIAHLLPSEQQKELQQRKPGFSIALHETTNYQHINTKMVKELEQAIQHKRQVAFRYRPSHDGRERQHRIEPYKLEFRKGHVYLTGWSLDWQRKYDFRLDNIIPESVESISITIAPNRPPARTYKLRYHLLAPIARYNVSQHFPEQKEDPHPDGSVTVTATITDLFEARRILLSYGENCIVEAPPELVKQICLVAEHYNKTYLNPAP